jgi:hypothetical protein
VIAWGPCAVAVIVAGEEEPIGFRLTERVEAAAPALPELGMVTATEELPDSPLLFVAVAVIWCWPAPSGTA